MKPALARLRAGADLDLSHFGRRFDVLVAAVLCAISNSMQQQALWSHFQNERTDLFTGAYWRLDRLVHYASTHYKTPDIVNIGTGDGYLERQAARLGWHVTAIDPDERAIHRLRAAGIDGRVGVVERIPLLDGSADVVFASEVFEHLTEDCLVAGLAEIARVLRPGGRLIGTVPYLENLAQQECVCPRCGLSFHRWGHLQSFTPERLASFLSTHFTNRTVRTGIFSIVENDGPAQQGQRRVAHRPAQSPGYPSHQREHLVRLSEAHVCSGSGLALALA